MIRATAQGGACMEAKGEAVRPERGYAIATACSSAWACPSSLCSWGDGLERNVLTCHFGGSMQPSWSLGVDDNFHRQRKRNTDTYPHNQNNRRLHRQWGTIDEAEQYDKKSVIGMWLVTSCPHMRWKAFSINLDAKCGTIGDIKERRCSLTSFGAGDSIILLPSQWLLEQQGPVERGNGGSSFLQSNKRACGYGRDAG